MSAPKTPAAKPVSPQASGKINYARTSRPSFNGAAQAKPAQSTSRGSQMVKKDQPKPAPRPAPHIANGPDRAAFNARWQRERQASRATSVPTKQVPPLPYRAARMAAFKAKRQAQEQQARAKEKSQSRDR